MGMVPDKTVHLSNNCYHFLKDQYQIKISLFSLVFPTYVQFCTKILVLFKAFLEANFFSSPRKFGQHDQHHPINCFPSHQQFINLNN